MRALRRGRRDDSGAVAVLVAILFPVLFGIAAFAVDVARWYVEGERVQKVADAAALAGVVYMPQDFTTAKTTALAVAAKNGYANGGDIQVTVAQGPRPSQLQVTVSNVITNSFAFLIGQPTTLIARTAISDYTGPAPMGSPCWSFGNEPDRLLQVRPNNCPNPANFWATVEGPATDKQQGDEFMTRACVLTGTSGCTGSTNSEFDPNGYFWAVHVENPAAVTSITLQIFDAAYVNTGLYCDDNQLPAGNSYRATGQNPFVSDARTRYAPGSATSPSQYCPGDYTPGTATVTNSTPPTTTFVLRSPVDSQNPLQAPVIGSCQRQFFGWSDPSSLTTVLDGNRATATSITDASRYQPLLAESFHRWATLCTIPGPLVRGDYYLQVRTNVAWNAATSAWSSTSDNTNEKGFGNNGFALRAQVSGDASQVSIGSIGHMPIFANDPVNSEATFNLIRVVPGAAGKVVKFTFFDVGDATGNGTAHVQVMAPIEATGTGISAVKEFATCTGIDWNGNSQALSLCDRTGISSSTWQGKFYTINVPIPPNYNCGYSTLSGCWFRVQYGFPTGTSLHDVTTWSASIEGDPVRLVK